MSSSFLTPLRIRIGINSGAAVVAIIGSGAGFNYIALGNTPNVVSRPEAITTTHGMDIMIGAETRRLAGNPFIVREPDLVTVHAAPPRRRSTSSSLSPMKARHLPRG
jgi:class 3 adenylate cyclase